MNSWTWTVLVVICALGGCSDEQQTPGPGLGRTTQSADDAQEQHAGGHVDVAQRCTVSREDRVGGGFISAPGNRGCVVRVANADKEGAIRSLTGLVCFSPGEKNEVTGIELRRSPRIARLIGGDLTIAGGSEFSIDNLDIEPGVGFDIFVELAAVPRKGYSVVFEAGYRE